MRTQSPAWSGHSEELKPLLQLDRGRYQIIAGARRYRAAKLAGLQDLAVIIKEQPTDDEVRQVRMLENWFRENLTPMEEARALQNLVTEYKTQVAVAKLLGLSEGMISERLKLLSAPPDVQAMAASGAPTNVQYMIPCNRSTPNSRPCCTPSKMPRVDVDNHAETDDDDVAPCGALQRRI